MPCKQPNLTRRSPRAPLRWLQPPSGVTIPQCLLPSRRFGSRSCFSAGSRRLWVAPTTLSTWPKAPPSKTFSRNTPATTRNSPAIAPLWWPLATRNSPLGARRSAPATKLPSFRRSAEADQPSMPRTQPMEVLFQLIREPIDASALIDHVRGAGDGAVVTFDGCVRNQSHGRRTLYLDYEAYESMALTKIREIASAVHEKFQIHRVAVAHRLGRLEIGETSVFIAVSAAHRPAAFDACRFAIDTLKRTLPIWKKEYLEDGAVWADGELPPAPPDTPMAKPAS